MKKYLHMLFAFLGPILGKAVLQTAADELARVAYPPTSRRSYPAYNRRPRTSYSQPPRGYTDRVGPNPFVEKPINLDGPGFHDVLMVAFDITGPNRAIVEEFLANYMPPVETTRFKSQDINLDSWWIADDNRLDETDTDSAVFVAKGNQTEARKLIRDHGLGH